MCQWTQTTILDEQWGLQSIQLWELPGEKLVHSINVLICEELFSFNNALVGVFQRQLSE